jgi:hypothetical protein
MSKKVQEEVDNQMIPIGTTVRRKVPTVERQVFTDTEPVRFEPFRYQEGQSVVDVIAQARQHRESLAEREKRTARMAKVTGWTNFLSSLANLAGGGYTQNRYNPSPIMQQSLNQLSNVQDEKYRSDLYYQELLRKIRQEDYNNQLKNHIDQQEKLSTLNLARTRENNRALNNAASDTYNMGAIDVAESGISGYEAQNRMKDQQIRETSANASATSANASMIRANADAKGTKKNSFLVYTDPAGVQRTMGKSQAQQIINDVASRFKGLATKTDEQLTPLEQSIKTDIFNIDRAMGSGNVEATDNLIRAVALKYLKDGYSEFQHYFDTEEATSQGSSAMGTFLPPAKSGQSGNKNLLQ